MKIPSRTLIVTCAITTLAGAASASNPVKGTLPEPAAPPIPYSGPSLASERPTGASSLLSAYRHATAWENASLVDPALYAEVADAEPPVEQPPVAQPGSAPPAEGSAEPSVQDVLTPRARTYLRFSGGLVTTETSDGPEEEIDFDEGFFVGAALGRRLGDADERLGVTAEIEGFWSDQDTDEDGTLEAVRDVTVLGALLNGIVDYRLSDVWTVYGGAGIGAAMLDVGTESDALNDFDDEDGPFLTWQLRAGVQWQLSERVALNAGYRFLNIDDAEIDDDIGDADFDLETQQHVIDVGLSLGL